MTGMMLTATVFEFTAIVLIITGFIFEDKVIKFEDRMIDFLSGAYKSYMRKRYIKKKAAKKQHLKAVPACGKIHSAQIGRIA